MADLNYDFNMNQFKNRLETFKDWPFTEETGSSCTARKVYQLCRFSDFETMQFASELLLQFRSRQLGFTHIFPIKLFFLVRWQKQDSSILPTIVILISCAVLFASRNLRDGNLRTILCTQELYAALRQVLRQQTETYHHSQGNKLAGISHTKRDGEGYFVSWSLFLGLCLFF